MFLINEGIMALWPEMYGSAFGRFSAKRCPKSIDGASLAVGRFPAKLGPTTHEMACLLGGLKIGLPG